MTLYISLQEANDHIDDFERWMKNSDSPETAETVGSIMEEICNCLPCDVTGLEVHKAIRDPASANWDMIRQEMWFVIDNYIQDTIKERNERAEQCGEILKRPRRSKFSHMKPRALELLQKHQPERVLDILAREFPESDVPSCRAIRSWKKKNDAE